MPLIDNDTNILFLIFQELDAKSLLNCSQVCRLWYQVYKLHPQSLWRALCKRHFNISSAGHRDWFQVFKTNFKYYSLDYKFIGSEDEFKYSSEKIEYGPFQGDLTRPYIVWPTHKLNTYLVAFENDIVCWLDQSREGPVTKIYGARLSTKNLVSSQNIDPDFVLEGGVEHLGLLLSNNESMLLAFDQASLVYVWNLQTLKLEGVIDTSFYLQTMVSMNVFKKYLIGGGVNQSVGIWNIYTREYVKGLNQDDTKGIPKNVGMNENVIVYALTDGTYHIHDFKTLEKKFVCSVQDAGQFFSTDIPELFHDTVDVPNVMNVNTVEQENVDSIIDQETGVPAIDDLINNPITTEAATVDVPSTEAVTVDESQVLQGTAPIPEDTQIPLIEPDAEQSEDEIDEILFVGFVSMYVPTVLSLNEHLLITNGYGNGNINSASDVLLWDLQEGNLVCSLSERSLKSRFAPAPRDADPIHVAEFSKDGTMIYSTVDQNDCCRLFLWDYCSAKRQVVANRAFLRAPGSIEPVDVWIVSPAV